MNKVGKLKGDKNHPATRGSRKDKLLEGVSFSWGGEFNF